MATLRDGVNVGPYVVERVLPVDRGNFARIAIARRQSNNTLHERVALKIAKTKVSVRDRDEAARRVETYELALRNEVETLRQLRHPGIVRLYPIPLDGQHVYTARALDLEGQPWYFVMEYLAGGSIKTLIEELGTVRCRLSSRNHPPGIQCPGLYAL